jgi:hypothetical protein
VQANLSSVGCFQGTTWLKSAIQNGEYQRLEQPPVRGIEWDI